MEQPVSRVSAHFPCVTDHPKYGPPSPRLWSMARDQRILGLPSASDVKIQPAHLWNERSEERKPLQEVQRERSRRPKLSDQQTEAQRSNCSNGTEIRRSLRSSCDTTHVENGDQQKTGGQRSGWEKRPYLQSEAILLSLSAGGACSASLVNAVRTEALFVTPRPGPPTP
ncbi:uncharacterized protein RBU33_014059 isoform 1-T1 [Hipposideros larvatus]